jgi:S-adenosylmethionine decarboxylase
VSLAKHVSIDCFGVDAGLLNDVEALTEVLRATAAAARCEVLGCISHRFSPQGASVALLLAESHLTIHTWPEHAYAAVDLLTCGATLPSVGVEILLARLAPKRHDVIERDRGHLK